MELTGNVVIEKDKQLSRATAIVCPACGAPKGSFCNPDNKQVCAERVVKQFASESKNLTGDGTIG